MAFIAPTRPSPRMLQPVLPGPGSEASFSQRPRLPGLGRDASEALFAGEEGGVEPVEVTTPSVLDTLGPRFGYSRGRDLPTTNDAAAVSGLAARAYKPTLDLAASERRRDALNADGIVATPSSRESALEDSYVAAQMAPVQQRDQQIQIANAQRQAAIMQEQQLSATLARQAAEQAFFARTGMPYNEKTAQIIAEFDARAAEDQGYQEEAHGMEQEKQQALAQARDAKEAAAISAHYDKQRQFALLRLALRLGAGTQGAFAQPKAGLLEGLNLDPNALAPTGNPNP